MPRERRAAMLKALTERDLGVPLAEVDASTFEPRVTPGLWLCGEVLDVEGRLGGFNFQWAWSSGTVAARAAGGSREGPS